MTKSDIEIERNKELEATFLTKDMSESKRIEKNKHISHWMDQLNIPTRYSPADLKTISEVSNITYKTAQKCLKFRKEGTLNRYYKREIKRKTRLLRLIGMNYLKILLRIQPIQEVNQDKTKFM